MKSSRRLPRPSLASALAFTLCLGCLGLPSLSAQSSSSSESSISSSSSTSSSASSAAQPSSSASAGTGSSSDLDEDLTASGEEAENPYFRFEIVSLGSYPITLLYTDLVFDSVLYVQSGFSSSSIPLSVESSLSDNDKLIRLGAALGVSCLVGAIDAVIHASKIKAKERLKAAALEAARQKRGLDAPKDPPNPPLQMAPATPDSP